MDTKIYILLFLLIEISYEKSFIKKGIFDETHLKNLKLKNRIFKGSVIDCSFIDCHITEEGLKIYENLAKNEIGTIFTGTAVVSDYNAFQDNPEFRMDKDEYIEEYKKLTSLVHKYNTNIMIQLIHNGMNTFSKDEIIYGPSKGKLLNQDRNSVEMTKEDILRIENDFVNAAIRSKKSRF